ncbi:FAD-dependent oxidoreductase [Halobellus litoreus]|uniref:FAD-dependent oxidoreductase n=1 Tax=Halobellus litoreus TaxID=755310 RepID=A0ABD6DRE0_9EURY
MRRRDGEVQVAIVGGGICGLTTALALEQRGFTVAVYEAASEYRPVGAGILLQTNALVALETLGVAAEIRDSGMPLSGIRIRSPRDRVLQTFDVGGVERTEFGYGFVAIRRAKLLAILRERLNAPIHTGKRCVAVSDPESPTVRFADGTRIRPDVLVGADGIDSRVRETISPVSTRSLNTTVFRALPSVSLDQRGEPIGFEVWGDGTYTGGAPIAEDRFYWFATAPPELSETASVDDIRSYFGGYPDPIPAIVESLAGDEIITTGLRDLPALDRWHRGSTVLAGDAAHGMLPFAGQGAAQSIEDAVALAHAFESNATVGDALTAYESVRASRANRVRSESHRLGQLATMGTPVAWRVRNAVVSALPVTLFRRFRRRRVADAAVPTPAGPDGADADVGSGGGEFV